MYYYLVKDFVHRIIQIQIVRLDQSRLFRPARNIVQILTHQGPGDNLIVIINLHSNMLD